MSEEIKNLSEGVNKLIADYRELKETGLKDVVQKEQFDRMETALKSEIAELRETLAAKNTPSVLEAAEEVADRYKEAFGTYLTYGKDTGQREGDVLKVKEVSLNVASEGGVFLPKVFSNQFTDLLRKTSAIRSRATVVSAGQNFVHAIKTAKGSAGVRDEKGAVADASSPAFNLVTFVPQAINARQKATAWAHDGDAQRNLVDLTIADLVGSLAEKEGDYFLNSTNQNPLAVGGGHIKTGLLTGTKNVSSVDRFTNVVGSLSGINVASSGVITFDDVLKLRSTLHSKYLPRAVYIINADTELQLLTIKDDNNRYLITDGDVTKGIPGSIFGNEYIVEDNMAASGTTGAKMVLADLSTYIIADHSAVRWVVNPVTDYTMVEYFAEYRTSAVSTDAQAVRALFNVAA